MAGCSLRTIGFRYADWIALHELDKYFDVTAAQKERFTPIIKSHIHWMKDTYGGILADSFDRYSSHWKKGFTAEEVRRIQVDYKKWRLEIAERVAKDAGIFLLSLSEGQIAHLEAELAESNETVLKNLDRDPKKYQKKHRKIIIEQIEYWLGSVSSDQEAKILEFIPPDLNKQERRFKGRLAAQKNFLSLIKKRLPPEQTAAQLVLWAKEPFKMREENIEQAEQRDRDIEKILLGVRALATPKQVDHGAEVLGNLARDLRKMSP